MFRIEKKKKFNRISWCGISDSKQWNGDKEQGWPFQYLAILCKAFTKTSLLKYQPLTLKKFKDCHSPIFRSVSSRRLLSDSMPTARDRSYLRMARSDPALAPSAICRRLPNVRRCLRFSNIVYGLRPLSFDKLDRADDAIGSRRIQSWNSSSRR